ncbi:uncharacterized protein [Palaemon carinicauda]|uniref:uncharacterized protein n=1 Tax=Palaemon carinicauda TaxID=392227 RepID=UPI0035B69D93
MSTDICSGCTGPKGCSVKRRKRKYRDDSKENNPEAADPQSAYAKPKTPDSSIKGQSNSSGSRKSVKVNMKKLESVLSCSSGNCSLSFKEIAEEAYKTTVQQEQLIADLLATIRGEANMSDEEASKFSLNNLQKSFANVFEELMEIPECVENPDIFEECMNESAEEILSNIACEAYSRLSLHEDDFDSLEEDATLDFQSNSQSNDFRSHRLGHLEADINELEVCHPRDLIQEPSEDLTTPQKKEAVSEIWSQKHGHISRPRKGPATSQAFIQNGLPVKPVELTPGSTVRKMKKSPKGKRKLQYFQKEAKRPESYKKEAADEDMFIEGRGKRLCSRPNREPYLEGKSTSSGCQDLPATRSDSSISLLSSGNETPAGSQVMHPVTLEKESSLKEMNQRETFTISGAAESISEEMDGQFSDELVSSDEEDILNEWSESPQFTTRNSFPSGDEKHIDLDVQNPSPKSLKLRINSNGLFSCLDESQLLASSCQGLNTFNNSQNNFYVRYKPPDNHSSVASCDGACKSEETLCSWKFPCTNRSNIASEHDIGEWSSEFDTSDSQSEFSSQKSGIFASNDFRMANRNSQAIASEITTPKTVKTLELQFNEMGEDFFATPAQRRAVGTTQEEDDFVTPVGRSMMFYLKEAPQKTRKIMPFNYKPKCRRSLVREFPSVSPKCSSSLQTPPKTPVEDDYTLLQMESDEEW